MTEGLDRTKLEQASDRLRHSIRKRGPFGYEDEIGPQIDAGASDAARGVFFVTLIGLAIYGIVRLAFDLWGAP